MPGQVTFFLLAKQMEHRQYVMGTRQDDLPIERLRGWHWSRYPEDDVHLNDISPVLSGHYDVIILGAWDEPTYLLLWAWAVAARKKLLFWIESTAYDLRRSAVREKYKRLLLRGASGCIVPGKRAYRYCQQLGMIEDRIYLAPNATDPVFFRNEAKRLLQSRQTLRAQSNCHGLVVLFAGRLVESIKGISTLVRASAELKKREVPLSLLLAGDGPDRRYYEELARREALADIRFLGMLDRESLCHYYAIADVLVLPSHSETWGFVLNEGMEFGLPLVVSEAVGAGPDLVRSGENGFVVPTGDAPALAQALERLALDEVLRRKMGKVSRSVVKSFSPERWARGVTRAIEAATDRSA